MRRIGLMRSLYVLGSVGFISVLVFGLVWGLRLVWGFARVAPAQQPSGPQLVYVLDYGPQSVALAVEVEDGQARVVRTYPLGYESDIVISPDGSVLYGVSRVFVSDDEVKDTLTVIDTASGRVLQDVGVPRWQGFAGPHGTHKIAISPDGTYVYILVGFVDSPPAPPQALATFDVAAGAMLPDVAPLDGCGSAPSILPVATRDVVVVCRAVDEVRFLEISSSGGLQGERRLSLPTGSETVRDELGNVRDVSFVSWAVLSPDGRTLYAVTRDGRVFVVDIATQSLAMIVDLQLPSGFLVAVPQVAISPVGDRLILGLGAAQELNASRAERIVTVGIGTWQDVTVIDTQPFSAMALAEDGEKVFVLDAWGADQTLREVQLQPALQPAGSRLLGQFGNRPVAVHSSGG